MKNIKILVSNDFNERVLEVACELQIYLWLSLLSYKKREVMTGNTSVVLRLPRGGTPI